MEERLQKYLANSGIASRRKCEEFIIQGKVKVNEEICKLRDKLNKSIECGESYDITYKLSIELDELIAKYYRGLEKSKKKLVCEI